MSRTHGNPIHQATCPGLRDATDYLRPRRMAQAEEGGEGYGTGKACGGKMGMGQRGIRDRGEGQGDIGKADGENIESSQMKNLDTAVGRECFGVWI